MEYGLAYAIYNKDENAVGEYELFTADNYEIADKKFNELINAYPLELPICLYSNNGYIWAYTPVYKEEYQKISD